MNQRRRVGWLKHFDFMLLDLICIEIAFLAGCFYRYSNFRIFTRNLAYKELNILLIALDLCIVLLFHSYHNVLRRGYFSELKNTLIQNFGVWGISMGILYMGREIQSFSRTVFSVSMVLSIVLMFIVRVIWKKFLLSRRSKSARLPRTLIVAAPDKAASVLKNISDSGHFDFNIIGVCAVGGCDTNDIEGSNVLCTDANLFDYIKSGVVDDVMLFLPPEDKRSEKIVQTLLDMGTVVHVGLDFWGSELPNNYCENIGGYNFLTTSISTAGVLHLLIKRIIDICAGIVGCIITGIAFIFVAPLIYKASPGPIFYSQTRVGKSGRQFKIYKFRSMYMDADARKVELMAQNEMQGNMFKLENDPRIIGSEKGPGKGIGNFIRRFSIDELPQFYNILKGDMSLVGTRPPTVDEVEEYDLHHMVRLSMKPGLTGMWQVSGRSSITDFEEVVRLDASYIKNWSLKLDIKIILKTFVAVFKKDGAE